MDCDGANVANAGMTRVLSGVLHPGLLNQEVGGGNGPLLRDLTDAAPDGGVGDGMLVVVPEDVLRRRGAVPHQTGQVHGEALLQVDVGSAQDLSVRL